MKPAPAGARHPLLRCRPTPIRLISLDPRRDEYTTLRGHRPTPSSPSAHMAPGHHATASVLVCNFSNHERQKSCKSAGHRPPRTHDHEPSQGRQAGYPGNRPATRHSQQTRRQHRPKSNCLSVGCGLDLSRSARHTTALAATAREEIRPPASHQPGASQHREPRSPDGLVLRTLRLTSSSSPDSTRADKSSRRARSTSALNSSANLAS